MKIIYFANFENKYSDTTERHITFSLKQLGHEVIEVNERDFDIEKIISLKGDLFLFHKGGELADIPLPEFIKLLNLLTIPKVCWYFDKAWDGREIWLETVIPFTDFTFMSDGSFLKRHNFKNAFYLNQGIGNEDMSLGTPKPQYECDIAFVGNVYKDRQQFCNLLLQRYGDKFKIFKYSFGRNLNDLCATAKIIVAPKYPSTEFYWSSRVYMITGSGGFMLHPRLEGLKEEFKDKENIAFYHDMDSLFEKIDYYLAHEDERKEIQKAGHELCTTKYTYSDRVKKILEIINQKNVGKQS